MTLLKIYEKIVMLSASSVFCLPRKAGRSIVSVVDIKLLDVCSSRWIRKFSAGVVYFSE